MVAIIPHADDEAFFLGTVIKFITSLILVSDCCGDAKYKRTHPWYGKCRIEFFKDLYKDKEIICLDIPDNKDLDIMPYAKDLKSFEKSDIFMPNPHGHINHLQANTIGKMLNAKYMYWAYNNDGDAMTEHLEGTRIFDYAKRVFLPDKNALIAAYKEFFITSGFAEKLPIFVKKKKGVHDIISKL